MANKSYGIDVVLSAVDKTVKVMNNLNKKLALVERVHKASVELQDKTSTKLNSINNKLKSFAGKTYRATLSIIDKGSPVLKKITSKLVAIPAMITGALGVYGIGDAFQKAKSFIVESYDSAVKHSKIIRALSQVGSKFGADQGGQIFEKLLHFSMATPFKVEDISDMYKSLAPLLSDGSNSLDEMNTKTLRIVKALGNASVTMDKGIDGAKEGLTAMMRAMATGKLSDKTKMALFSSVGLTPAAIGEQLTKMGYNGEWAMNNLKKSGISAMKFIEAATQALEEKFKYVLGAASKGVPSILKNLHTLEHEAKKAFGEGMITGIKPILTQISDYLFGESGQALEKVAKLEHWAKELGAQFGKYMGDTFSRVWKIFISPEFEAADMKTKIDMLTTELSKIFEDIAKTDAFKRIMGVVCAVLVKTFVVMLEAAFEALKVVVGKIWSNFWDDVFSFKGFQLGGAAAGARIGAFFGPWGALAGLIFGHMFGESLATSNIWTDMKANAMMAWEELKTFISEKWDNICSIVSNAVSAIGKLILLDIGGAITSITSALNSFLELLGFATKSKIQVDIEKTNEIAQIPSSLVAAHALGGTFSTPHIGLVAEAGTESVVPHNSRGRSIWDNVGQTMGWSKGANDAKNEINIYVTVDNPDAHEIANEIAQRVGLAMANRG